MQIDNINFEFDCVKTCSQGGKMYTTFENRAGGSPDKKKPDSVFINNSTLQTFEAKCFTKVNHKYKKLCMKNIFQAF